MDKIITKEVTGAVDSAVQLSETQFPNVTISRGSGGIYLVNTLASGALDLYPWWSPIRDRQLDLFWKRIDYLSGAVYTMASKMTAIPFHIEAKDNSIREHVKLADVFTELLYDGAEYGEGWSTFYEQFVVELLTQDNGTFAAIIGDGDPGGPLVGPPISIIHLDSLLCTRTGDPEYPVLYFDPVKGTYSKLHYSRVIFKSQMKSPRKEMLGVGYCSVSRATNVSQTMLDVLTFKREKLGSRPHRAIIVTSGGLDPEDVTEAMRKADETFDNQGLSRYSRTVVSGSSTVPDAKLNVYDLSSMPDGFDEQTSITYGMAAIALAIGVDARELWPAIGAGASRADALIQHLKQRGKGPGQIIETTERSFNQKYLPRTLKMVFDYQDDEQDRQQADTRLVRTNRRRYDLQSGASNIHIEREKMLEDGDLTQSQFERLELDDGRLPDGTSVLTLFYSDDPKISRYLNLGVDDPLDILANDAMAMIQVIHEKLKETAKVTVNASTNVERWPAYRAMKALARLEKAYETGEVSPLSADEDSQPPNPTEQTLGPEGGTQPADERAGRNRRENLLTPNVPTETSVSADMKPDKTDDGL